jgi:hypothetical protein
MRSARLRNQRVAESANPLFDDEELNGLVDRLPGLESSDDSDDGFESAASGERFESAGSDLDPDPEPGFEISPTAMMSPKSLIRAVDVPQTERQDAADRKRWSAIKDLKWGRQLAEMESEGWLQPAPDHDLIDEQLGKRVFVRDLGFGRLLAVRKKKRGWGPCDVAFVDGDHTMLVVLRLSGKEMGTPFLIAPTQLSQDEAQSAAIVAAEAGEVDLNSQMVAAAEAEAAAEEEGVPHQHEAPERYSMLSAEQRSTLEHRKEATDDELSSIPGLDQELVRFKVHFEVYFLYFPPQNGLLGAGVGHGPSRVCVIDAVTHHTAGWR